MAKMYRMPKLVDTPQILELPGTMYKMPVINKINEMDLAATYYGQTRATGQTQNGPDVAALEARQEAVLSRLRNLKTRLDKVQGNKINLSPSVSAASVLGAPAHSSPSKVVSNPKREMVRAVAAMGGHLADLTSLQFDTLVQPKRRSESCQREMKQQHDSILQRLGSLRTELDRLTAASKQADIPQSEPLSLAERQQGILGVIKELKSEMGRVSLLQQRPVSEKTLVHDLVISANPQYPPYSLVLLRKLLKQAGSPVLAINHLHSSVIKVDDRIRECFSEQPLAERRDHPLAFTLHWKDIVSPTLMVNPLRQTQICSEVNIVRYISRLFPLTSAVNYEAMGTFPTIAETDQLLDQLSKQLSSTSNNKERQAALRMLNGRLGKNAYLIGNSCGVVDVLAWSLVRQLSLDSGAPSNVAKWYKNITSMAGLELETQAPKSEPSKSIGKSNTDTKQEPKKKKENSPKPTTVNAQVIANGDKNSHMNRAGLESYLKNLGIKYQVKEHEEVFTVEALMKCVKDVAGLHMKNLFLKDKKKKDLYLLSARHDAEVKLNDVAKQVGVKELRFADESVMLDVIGVAQGCVTPFALVNDKEHKVTFLCDSAAFDVSHSFVNFHPLSNAATLGVAPNDFKKFLGATGHEAKLLNFS